MRYSFRDYHLITFLTGYSSHNEPLDLALRNYFKKNKALGSKDRCLLAEEAFGLVRWKGLLEALVPAGGWPEKISLFRQAPWKTLWKNLPPHQASSLPAELYSHLCQDYGADFAKSLALASNERAPTFLRVNTLKCSRDELLARWRGKVRASPTETSFDGIILEERLAFYTLEEYRQGLFEAQDEGSQLIAALVQAQPGDHVMDFCAGAGGKALALAPRLQGRGEIILSDIRSGPLLEAKRRLRRAGVQNAQIMPQGHRHLSRWHGRMDWVLIDAPCTGTGTLRRNPDMKWRFTSELLRHYVELQRSVFLQAYAFLKPTGKIVYTTCSILKEENERQIDFFQEFFNLKLSSEPFQSFPQPNKMDGFFGAVLVKK